ncbi:MAG: hypothetical protein KDA24_04575 [Deltaproteobacteria bacterium]|nr:hypothetical protein [Deltaproteobacteria bacterium]
MALSSRATAVLLTAGLLGACTSAAPQPEAPAQAPETAPPPIAVDGTAPAEFSPDWSDDEGWHRIASLRAIQRRPEALAASRSSLRVAVLGSRGRRVTVVEPDRDPYYVLMPKDIVAADIAFDDTVAPPALVVSSARSRVLVRMVLAEGRAQELAREDLAVGRSVLESRPDGGVDVLDGMQRPSLEQPAVRGLLAPSGQRYRGVRQDTLAGIVGSGPAGRRMAMLARIPKAQQVRVLGMDPAPAAAGAAPGEVLDTGWLAAWTGEDDGRRLHFARFDAQGRVLLTTPAPATTPSPPPEGFDLRAGLLPDRQMLMAFAGAEGLDVWRFVPGPDGQRLRIEGFGPADPVEPPRPGATGGTEGSSAAE